jgi:hypothetical protein
MCARVLVQALAMTVFASLNAFSQEQGVPAIRALSDTQELWCWYVESNSAGKHGYAAQDVRLDSWFPDRCKLFERIADFKAALRAKGLSHVRLSTSAPITRAPLYIRPLTDSEMEKLRE